MIRINKIKLNYINTKYHAGKLKESGNADVLQLDSSIRTGLSGHLLCEAFLNPQRETNISWQYYLQFS